MAKQLNVSLAFTADTGKAKAQIQDLQKTLDSLITGSGQSGELGLTKDLVQARSAAADLKVALQGATTATGSIDLSKLNDAFKRSNKDLRDYRQQLEKLGPQGQQAFLKLSQSIMTAEAPLKRTNKLLDEFKTTMANTVRWQISSSILHGFMGTLQSAYGYAKDLNESLNNIRIVTGQTTEQMAKFAEQANRSAKALSTTTTAYTDAALIFYQQGLDDAAVKERTDAVIKMANVTKDSETEVSSYMTAIWNNFAGEKANLESYADVITALGAATASSSAEIAGGLEKFAAIGQQIGLSYDYATTALATVVARTRQSEDVVGTAFKTIFARIQGLNLGETLDDGTDLNKYSKALAAVGINIKDASGELKNMDTILEEMGSRWQTLAKDEQVALAQTVAGVRQYNQLIALMDSWQTDFKDNLKVAQNSSGALQEQADIYAESWEAARDRVKAAAEGIYSSLLDDKFFISVLNGFEKVLTGVDGVIDSLGGLRGVLPGVILLINKLYGDSIAKNIDNMIFNIERQTKKFKEQQSVLRENAYEEAMKVQANSGTELGDAKINSLKTQNELQKVLYGIAKDISAEDVAELQHRLDIVSTYRKQVEEMAKLKDEKSDNLQDSRQGMVNKAQRSGKSSGAARRALADIQAMETAATKAKRELEQLDKEFGSGKNVKAYADGLKQIHKNLTDAGFSRHSTSVKALGSVIGASVKDVNAFNAKVKELAQNGEFADRTFIDIDNVAGHLGEEFNWTTQELDGFRQKVAELTSAGMDMDAAIDAASAAIEDFRAKAEAAKSAADSMGTTGQTIVRAFSGISQITMGISSLGAALEALKDKDMKPMEKFKQVTQSLLIGIPALVMGIGALAKMNQSLALAVTAEGAAESKNLLIKASSILITGLQNVAKKAETGSRWANVTAMIAEQAAAWPLLAVTLLLVAAMAALAAIVAVVVTIAKAISNAYNADAIAAENAANAAKGLAEAYDEAKAHYESMVQAMEKYQTARDALDQLTKGTQEYRDALKQANDAALNLINQTNGLQRGKDYDWENGELKISDEAMDRIKEQESERVSAAEASSLMADARARQLAAKSNTTNLVRSDDMSMGAAIGTGAAGGAAAGAGIGVWGAGIGAVPGAIIGGIVGAIGGALTAGINNSVDNTVEESRIDELTELYRTMGDEAFDAAKLEELGFDTANKAYIESVKDIVKETISAEEQLSNAARMAAEITMSENENYSQADGETQDKVANVGGKLQEDLYEDAYDKYFKMTKNDDLFGVGSKENKQAMQAYAQQMGLDQLNGYKVTNYKKGGNVEYEYIDEEGKKQTKEVTREQIAMQLAATEAAEALGAQTDKLVETFNRLETSTNAADQALSDFLGGDMEHSNKEEFDAIASELGVSTGDKIDETQADSYLAANIGNGDGVLTDDEAKEMGYESAQAMKEAFVQEFNSTSGAWQDVHVPDTLSSSIADGLSLKTAQTLENTINDLNLGPAGEKAGEDFVAGLNTILADIDTEDQQAAMQALMDIDWSSWDALEQADAVLQQFGGDIDLTSEEWKQFAEEMRTAAGATPDYTTLKTDLNEISAILNDLDFGKVIKEEDYQKLVAYNNEWERFFMLQADGSRQFIGNSKDMQEELRNNVREQRKELQERKAAQEGFKNANWGHEDNETGQWVSADWKNKSGSDTGTAQNLLNATGATQDMLETLGYTDEIIQDIITKAQSGQEDLVAEGTAQLREMYQRIGEFQGENLDDMDKQFDEMLASTAQNLSDLLALKDEISSEAFDKQMSAIAGITSSMVELQQLLSEGLSAESYQENLQRLAGEYDNCTAELEEYKQALLSGDEEQQIAAQHALESSIKLGESCKKYGLVAEDVETQARMIAKAQDLDADSANRLAIANQRMNKGVKTLHDNWKDWNKILSQSDHTTMDYATTLNDAMDALADLTGTMDVASIPLEFLDSTTESGQHNLELLGKAAEGDVNAINQLGVALGQAAVEAMEFNEALVQSAIDGGMLDSAFDLTAFNNYKNEVLEGVTALQEAVQNGTLTAGQNITALMDGTGQSWVDSLNQMAIATGMSVDQMNSLLNQLGVQAKVDVVDVPQKMSVPTYTEVVEPNEVTVYNSEGQAETRHGWTHYTVPGPSKEVDGVVQVAQISTEDGSVGAPQVTYTGTSGSSSGFGGVSPSSTKPSGGGDKPKDPKKLDKKKNEEVEEDRYHVITEQLERLNDELEKISKAKDRAFGPKKLALMDAEIAKQEELIAKNKEYATALKNNRDAEMEQLKALGAVFDDKGVITNYNELIKANQADYSKYNEKVDYYNGLSAEEQEALDKAYQSQTDTDGNYYSGYQDFIEKTLGETAEKRQEEFEKLLKNYESDQEEYEKIMQEIQDAKNAIFDEKLEKIDYVVQIKLDVDERDIKYLEFLLEELEDKDFHAAEAIANIGMQTGKTLDQIDQYKNGIEDILSLSGYDGGLEGFLNGDVSLEELQEGGLTEEGLAKLEEYVDGLADANEQLREMRENAWAQVNDEFEEYLEKMDRGIEKIEHLKSITQSYQNIVDIVGKKFLGVSNDLIDKMNKSVVSQSQDLLKANKAKMEALQASYDQLKNEDTSGWSDQALKERQQLLNKMEDELQSAKEAFMSSWEEALQASADRYAQAVDNIIEEFSDKIAGLYGSLDELQEAYDRASDLDSQYLEDYEQIYQLSKLTRDINNSIDDTDNIAAKEEYRDLLEEINQIEEDGTKLSEYDLEVLQKKFELKQAQIALEEAQNAKSSVGMVRGEDGNYSYVYTANDDDVANAEQNYEDKLHEMQVLNGDYINNLQEQIIQTQAECAEALAAIKESDFNSYEEWREAVDRTQAYYDQKMDFYYSQLDGALTNNRELYENDWQKYHDLTGYKISDDENYVDKFEETNYSILTGYQTLEEAHGAWTAATGEMLLSLSGAYSEWQTEVENAMALAGTSVDEFAEKMEEDTERNVEDSGKAGQSVVDMGQQMEETFSDTLSAITDWESEWGSAIDNAIAKNKELIKSFNEMKREMANAMDAVSDYNPGGDSGGDSNSDDSNPGGNSGSDDSNSGGANNADKVEGVAAAIWMDGGATSGWYNGSDRKSRLKEKGVTGAQAYINAHGPNGDIYATWNKKRNQLKSFYYGSFDTGGYTGDWGDKSGRLALLHSKEIVLNAKDTENFLQAIDMVREISSRIDLNAKYTAGMMDMIQPSIGRGGTPEIVQNIEINADFPDATDHSEIELAFNNLINTASQYANRVR